MNEGAISPRPTRIDPCWMKSRREMMLVTVFPHLSGGPARRSVSVRWGRSIPLIGLAGEDEADEAAAFGVERALVQPEERRSFRPGLKVAHERRPHARRHVAVEQALVEEVDHVVGGTRAVQRLKEC